MENAYLYPEQCLSGAILVDPNCLAAARSIAKPTDFLSAPCAAVFRAACRLSDAGQTVDPVTILDNAASHGDSLEPSYLEALMELTPTAAHAPEYAESVHNNAIRRSVLDLARDIQEKAENRETAVSTLLSDALGQLQKIEAGQVSKKLMSSEDTAIAFLDHRERVDSGNGVVVQTGYSRLDKLLGGGMIQEGLYILAARPGIGKTTLALKIADHVSKAKPVLFVSLEMAAEQLTARRIADRTGLPIQKLLHGSLTDNEHTTACTALSDIAKTSLHINATPGASVADVALFARSIPNLALICIDYLGLIQPDGKAGSQYEIVTRNSNALKRLARSMKVPVLCLAQLNRATEQRSDKRPSMADLRDSGAIEQDADVVLLLNRPSAHLKPNEKPPAHEPEILELDVAKNRHGPTGNINLSFYGINGRVRE